MFSFSLTKITLVIQLNPLAPSLSHPRQRIAIRIAVPTIVPHSGSPHDMLTMPIPSVCLSVCLSVTTTLYVWRAACRIAMSETALDFTINDDDRDSA